MLKMETLLMFVFLVVINTLTPTSGQSIDEMILAASETVEDFDFMSDPSAKEVRVELDMKLLTEQYKDLYEPDHDGHDRQKRKAIRSSRYRWPNKRIPYHISRGVFSSRDEGEIKKAIAEWEEYTCLKFPQKTGSDENFINFDNGQGCYSYVGKVGGTQTIGLAGGCRYKGVIVHEIGHAVGFHHEQNRPDRDDHVTIMKQNIYSNVFYNFRKYPKSAINIYDVPYDYGSIMHYGGKAFTKNSQYTIKTKDPKDQHKIGNREGLSFNDIMLANKMYSCSDHCGSSGSCGRNSFRGKDCKCWCKGPSRSQPIKRCDATTGTTKRTTTTATTTTPTKSCRDSNSHCEVWAKASQNYCKTNTYVKTYCRKSCGTCDGDDDMTCADKKGSCDYWKGRGYCDGIYEVFMTNNCPKSCERCSASVGQGEGINNNSIMQMPSILTMTVIWLCAKLYSAI